MSILSNYYDFNSCINQLVIKQFSKKDLIGGKLILLDALPGDVIIIDEIGKVMNNVIQIQHLDSNNNCIGVDIDLLQYEINGKWKARYNKIKDINTTLQVNEKLSMEDLIKISLIFN